MKHYQHTTTRSIHFGLLYLLFQNNSLRLCVYIKHKFSIAHQMLLSVLNNPVSTKGLFINLRFFSDCKRL